MTSRRSLFDELAKMAFSGGRRVSAGTGFRHGLVGSIAAMAARETNLADAVSTRYENACSGVYPPCNMDLSYCRPENSLCSTTEPDTNCWSSGDIECCDFLCDNTEQLGSPDDNNATMLEGMDNAGGEPWPEMGRFDESDLLCISNA